MRSNEDALDLFADLLEPVAEILADEELVKTIRSDGKLVTAVKLAIKRHKREVVEILARLEDKAPEEYEVNLLALPVKLLNLLGRPEIKELFISQGQSDDAAPSGSATGNIGDGVL